MSIGSTILGGIVRFKYHPNPLFLRFHPKLKCLDDENFAIGWS